MNTHQCDEAKLDREILRPYTHIMTAGSNTVVAYDIAKAFNHWFKVPQAKLEEVQDIAYSFYNCTFILDDIQDASHMRRLVPTSHVLYGMPLTVNALLQAYTKVIKRIAALGIPEALDEFFTRVNNMFRGQGIDIYARENLILFSEEYYKWMANLKSSQAMSITTMLLQHCSNDKRDYSKLSSLLGVWYQIRDDWCNLVRNKGIDGGGHEIRLAELDVASQRFCEDFTDGKFSFPVLHALRNQESPEASTLIYALKQRPRDYEIKKYCLSILKKLGSLDYTLSVVREMDKEMRNEIRRLGGNPIFEALLDEFYV